jgi:L-rhamnose isomerase
LKSLPWTAVWNHYCMKQGVPIGMDWFEDVKSYEKDVLSKRS